MPLNSNNWYQIMLELTGGAALIDVEGAGLVIDGGAALIDAGGLALFRGA